MSQTRYDAVKPLRMTVTSDLESIPKARAASEQMALRIGFSAEQARMITLTIDEALANVIQHGYRGVGGKPIHITIGPVCVEGRSGMGILIRDQAEPVDPATIRGRDLDEIRPGGLGLHLMKSVMDKVLHTPGETGMVLEMIKFLSPG